MKQASRGAGAALVLLTLTGLGPPQGYRNPDAPYDGLFHFARVRYGGDEPGFRRRGGDAPWSHDWPRADHNFTKIIDEVTLVRTLVTGSNTFALDDPELFRFPLAYLVEPGFWNPTDAEARALGEYLRKGGFLVVDDFRGPYELENLRIQLRRALPEAEMILLDESEEIFDSFFRIVPSEVIPPYGGQPAAWYGIYEDNDRTRRLQVIVNHNNDLMEYWEYSDYGFYPIDLSNEAYKLGVNYVVYALTH